MRAYAKPMLVEGLGRDHQRCQALENLPLRAGDGGFAYDERWLQMLIQQHPSLLPIGEIEPSLSDVVPVCVELRLPSGYVDNLMLTPDGGLVVIETKLWRNPQARREVVGQVLDYAKDLSRFTYGDLETAVGMARRDEHVSLFRLVRPDAPPETEAPFIDAVVRNLRLGRMLLIIAGDGVQESAEDLTDFVQRHLGLHFTLAMVEMSLWKSPGDDRVLVQPRILAKTVQIERAVIRIQEGGETRLRIEPAPAATSKPTTLTAETFYEALGANDPALPNALKAFLAEIEPLEVHGEVQFFMRLAWRSPEGRVVSLGSIDAEGRVFTDTVHNAALAVGRIDLSDRYKSALAALAGGEVQPSGKAQGLRLLVNGRSPMLSQLLAEGPAWKAAMAEYVDALRPLLD